MKRKVISFVLCLSMLITLIPILSMSAQAYTSCSQADAVAYVNSLKGQPHDVDNGSYDCVDIAKLYFKQVGGMEYLPQGNASYYASTAAIPSGWTRQYVSAGYSPQPGDVAVWAAGYHAYTGNNGRGHIAVIVRVSGSTIYFVDQDSNLQRAAEENHCTASDPTCYIHPDFSNPPPSVSIPEGNYIIYSALDTTKCIDVMGCSMDSGATIDLWEHYDNGFQKFQIKRESDGYNITNTSSGKSLDIENASTSAGANVQQWQTNYTNAQRWYFEDAGGGYFYIRSAVGTYLDVAGGQSQNGANIQTYSFNGSAAQKFKLELISPSISVSNTVFQTVDHITVEFGNWNGATAFSYYLTEFPEGFGYTTYAQHEDVAWTSKTFTDLPAGHYSIFVHAINDISMSSQSNWLSFDVYDRDYIPTVRQVYDDHIYAVYDCEMSWTFARDLCTYLGGHLVTINDAEESAFIKSLIGSGGKDAYWLGASNFDWSSSNQDGRWSWVTGESFSYTNWNTGEPSASGIEGTREHWAEIRKSYNYKWNDVNNTNKANKGFILELEPSDADITARARYNGSEYLIIDRNIAWSEAVHYCKLLGGDLYYPDDAEEAAFVDSFIEHGKRSWYFVGAVRYDGAWHRVNDGSMIPDSTIDWSGNLWGDYCNYLMKYKSNKRYLNLPNVYYPEKDISNIGFICEIPNDYETVSVQATECNGGFDITPTGVESGIIIIGLYDLSERMVEIHTENYTGRSITYTPTKHYSYAKVMLLNDNYAPLCAAAEITP